MARPIRYTFILALVAAGATLAAVGGWRYARASSPVSGPIVLVSIDALRADHLPLYGYTGVKTPAFDALGGDGVVFERAYAHAPQSLPSHASLLTGRLPFEIGVRDDVGFVVKDTERMVAEILKDRDFSTAAFVSSFMLRKNSGLAQGFELYDDELPPAVDGIEPLERDGESAERAAEVWLQDGHTSRAFLFLQLAEPRHPYTVREGFEDLAPYDGEIARADQILGRLVRYLKTHQLYDQSTIIVVSSHGKGLGDHGEQTHGLFVYDEALRVPLIVKPAAGEGTGRRVRDVVQLVDLTPTILDLAKAPVPGTVRGRSLRQLLAGGGALPDRTVYGESFYGHYHFGWSGLTTITDGRYRYIQAPRPELYDLQADPAERENLVVSHPDVAARLRGALHDAVEGSTLPRADSISSEDRERFAALGDVDAGAVAGPDDGSLGELVDPKDVYRTLEVLRAAVEHDRAREWPEALALLEQLLQDAPSSADLWRRLGSVAARAGRQQRAIEAFERAVPLTSDDAGVRVELASALFTAHRFREARAHAERVASSSAASHDSRERRSARELLVRIALAERDSAAALSVAERARETDPERPLVQYVQGRLLLDERRYEDALYQFEQALDALNPPIVDLHSSAAQALSRLDRYAEAEYHFREELRLFPADTRARADLAALYQAAGRPDEAATALEDLIRITPTPDAYLLAARTWASFGDVTRAADLRARAHRF